MNTFVGIISLAFVLLFIWTLNPVCLVPSGCGLVCLGARRLDKWATRIACDPADPESIRKHEEMKLRGALGFLGVIALAVGIGSVIAGQPIWENLVPIGCGLCFLLGAVFNPFRGVAGDSGSGSGSHGLQEPKDRAGP
jgi:hypothetical protein